MTRSYPSYAALIFAVAAGVYAPASVAYGAVTYTDAYSGGKTDVLGINPSTHPEGKQRTA